MADIITPKLKVPFCISGSAAEVVEQDELDELAQCVEAIVRCPLGYREDEPEFGMDDQAFLENGIDSEELRSVIERWEPRADLLVESELQDLMNTVTINVTTTEPEHG